MEIYNRFFSISKATSCRTYSHDHVQLWMYIFFSLESIEHKHPHLWLWDSTQRFRSSAVVDLVAATLALLVLMVWEWISIVTLKGECTVQFRSQNSASKAIAKHALGFSLDTLWNRSEILITWWA